MYIDLKKRKSSKYTIYLSLEQSLEWLALYSSQVGLPIINNTLLIDNNDNIIGYKDNGVYKNIQVDTGKSESLLISVKNTFVSDNKGFYIIDINKKAVFIDKQIKYDYNRIKFVLLFREFFKTGNKNLFDNI